MELRLAAQHSGYTWEEFCRLPGSDKWLENGGDTKSDVLVFYRACKIMEALQYQDIDNAKPPRKR